MRLDGRSCVLLLPLPQPLLLAAVGRTALSPWRRVHVTRPAALEQPPPADRIPPRPLSQPLVCVLPPRNGGKLYIQNPDDANTPLVKPVGLIPKGTSAPPPLDTCFPGPRAGAAQGRAVLWPVASVQSTTCNSAQRARLRRPPAHSGLPHNSYAHQPGQYPASPGAACMSLGRAGPPLPSPSLTCPASQACQGSPSAGGTPSSPQTSASPVPVPTPCRPARAHHQLVARPAPHRPQPLPCRCPRPAGLPGLTISWWHAQLPTDLSLSRAGAHALQACLGSPSAGGSPCTTSEKSSPSPSSSASSTSASRCRPCRPGALFGSAKGPLAEAGTTIFGKSPKKGRYVSVQLKRPSVKSELALAQIVVFARGEWAWHTQRASPRGRGGRRWIAGPAERWCHGLQLMSARLPADCRRPFASAWALSMGSAARRAGVALPAPQAAHTNQSPLSPPPAAAV